MLHSLVSQICTMTQGTALRTHDLISQSHLKIITTMPATFREHDHCFVHQDHIQKEKKDIIMSALLSQRSNTDINLTLEDISVTVWSEVYYTRPISH